jgi:GTP pyrophosphokinase
MFQHKGRASGSGSGVLVVGVDKLLTVPAKCCKPAPPDPVVGFVTRGRGVTIHRASCSNLRSMDTERLIDVQWGQADGGSFEVDIEIEAADRTGLLRDVSDMLVRERINVMAANTETRDAHARMSFTVEVKDLAQLERVLVLLGRVPGVVRARRR